MAGHIQDEVHSASLSEAGSEAFWMRQADQLQWQKKPSRALEQSVKSLPDGIQHPHWTWFPGGSISTTYNCVDRHVHNGRGDATALVWDSPVSKSRETYTYKELLREVETLAGVLREEGLRRGDVVIIYSEHAKTA